MRTTIGQLKRMIREGLLLEASDDVLEEGDSLDSQVDRYLSQYESESKSSKNEGKDFRAFMRRFLREAEGDEEKEDDVSKDEEQPPTKISSDKLDVESFAGSVMRLIDNYDSLLEFRTTVAKRAINFLAKSYEPDVVESFKSVMRDDYGVVPGESEQDVKDDNYAAPAADRAGPSPGGAALAHAVAA